MEGIDTFNKFMVGSMAGQVTLLRGIPPGGLTKQDALLLAAYLVAMADPGREEFDKVLAAVLNA